jgi:hypothetical protein
MSEKRVQLLVGVQDAVLSEIIGRLDRAYTLAPRLLVERLAATVRRDRRIVRPVRGHSHPPSTDPSLSHSGRPRQDRNPMAIELKDPVDGEVPAHGQAAGPLARSSPNR